MNPDTSAVDAVLGPGAAEHIHRLAAQAPPPGPELAAAVARLMRHPQVSGRVGTNPSADAA